MSVGSPLECQKVVTLAVVRHPCSSLCQRLSNFPHLAGWAQPLTGVQLTAPAEACNLSWQRADG